MLRAPLFPMHTGNFYFNRALVLFDMEEYEQVGFTSTAAACPSFSCAAS